MPQKVIDILPPNSVSEEKISEKVSIPKSERKTFGFLRGKKEEKIKKEKEIKKRKPFPKTFLISFLVIIVGGLAIFSYFFSFGAKIIIWPKQDSLNPQIEVTVNKETKDINIFAKTIPGYLFQEEKSISQEFSATGKTVRETKAEGTIKVYNNYSTTSQVIIANTRFISADGKIFRSLERVVIPGGTYEKGKLQPASIDVKVRADKAGEEYNIGSSTFSIPGFAGTPKYTGFYGKSSESMKGGFKGEASQVTEQDINNAKNTLTQKLFEETRKNLKEKISPEFVFSEDLIQDKVLETGCPSVGAFQNTFVCQIKGNSGAILFKKADLENFGKETILFQKSPEKKLNEKSLNITYTSLEKKDLDLGKYTLNLNISAKVFNEINEQELKGNITGKTSAQVSEFLSTQSQIERTEIKLLPFWAKSTPADKDKIRIELKID